MNLLISAFLLVSSGDVYTAYPALGDKIQNTYQDQRVLTITDKGIVRELIVACSDGTEGIMVHDVVEDTFCDSKLTCHKSLGTAIAQTCKP